MSSKLFQVTFQKTIARKSEASCVEQLMDVVDVVDDDDDDVRQSYMPSLRHMNPASSRILSCYLRVIPMMPGPPYPSDRQTSLTNAGRRVSGVPLPFPLVIAWRQDLQKDEVSCNAIGRWQMGTGTPAARVRRDGCMYAATQHEGIHIHAQQPEFWSEHPFNAQDAKRQ